MAKPVSNARKAQVAHSWGILLGMMGLPVLAVLSKIYPQQDLIWEVLAAAFGLVIVRSTVGYLFPSLGSGGKKPTATTLPQTR